MEISENSACVWQTIKEEQIQENCAVVGTHLLKELSKLREKYEIVGDVRGKGLHIGVEMVKDKVRLSVFWFLCNISILCCFPFC